MFSCYCKILQQNYIIMLAKDILLVLFYSMLFIIFLINRNTFSLSFSDILQSYYTIYSASLKRLFIGLC